MRISGEPMGVEGRFNYAFRWCGTNIRGLAVDCLLSKKEFMPDNQNILAGSFQIICTFKPYTYGGVSVNLFLNPTHNMVCNISTDMYWTFLR